MRERERGEEQREEGEAGRGREIRERNNGRE
jgi:hypothetical protein